MDGTLIPNFFFLIASNPIRQQIKYDCCSLECLLCSAFLLSVNGFDERFQYPGYGEDIDLEFRLARKGIPSVSRKCQVVQFHCYHKHFDTNYEPNKKLLQENTENNVTYTPHGICK